MKVWGAVHDPFGKATIDAGSTVELNVRFPGQYYDGESGLHYNYFRYYDPGTGRYVTSDPIGLGDGANTYSYVRNKPLTVIDPTGQTGCSLAFSIPTGFSYNTKTEWADWGEWEYVQTIAEGGERSNPFLAVKCHCKRKRSGTEISSYTVDWLDVYACTSCGELYMKTRNRSGEPSESDAPVIDADSKIVGLGIYGNQTSAEFGCREKCASLN